MSIRIIHDILDTRLATTTNIPDIIGENETTTRTQNSSSAVYKTPYCRTTLIPARTDTVTLGNNGHDRWYGLYQIDLFFPTNDGVDGSNYAADQIINNFPAGTLITDSGITVRMSQTPWREAGFESSQWYIVPVVIAYEAYIQR